MSPDGKDILSVKMHLNSERQAEEDAQSVTAELEAKICRFKAILSLCGKSVVHRSAVYVPGNVILHAV